MNAHPVRSASRRAQDGAWQSLGRMRQSRAMPVKKGVGLQGSGITHAGVSAAHLAHANPGRNRLPNIHGIPSDLSPE